MNYKDLEEINKELKTTDIKGKDYVEVNQRVKAFRKLYPEGFIDTIMLSNENGICIFKAQIGTYEEDGSIKWLATGHAYEKENSTFINKTSYIENCETSAVGRALGNMGIGIDVSIASAEEVQNAILQQDAEKTISNKMVEALREAIGNNNIENETVIAALEKLGHTKLAELKDGELQKFRESIGI